MIRTKGIHTWSKSGDSIGERVAGAAHLRFGYGGVADDDGLGVGTAGQRLQVDQPDPDEQLVEQVAKPCKHVTRGRFKFKPCKHVTPGAVQIRGMVVLALFCTFLLRIEG